MYYTRRSSLRHDCGEAQILDTMRTDEVAGGYFNRYDTAHVLLQMPNKYYERYASSRD